MENNNHYQIALSNTCCNEKKITPTWIKVSATPWTGKAAYHRGYGRRCINASLSDDMPKHFTRTEYLARPEPLKPSPKVKVGSKYNPEAALVLPGGATEQDRPTHGHRYQKLIHDKQLLLEPVVSDRSGRSDIKWGNSPTELTWIVSGSQGDLVTLVKTYAHLDQEITMRACHDDRIYQAKRVLLIYDI